MPRAYCRARSGGEPIHFVSKILGAAEAARHVHKRHATGVTVADELVKAHIAALAPMVAGYGAG